VLTAEAMALLVEYEWPGNVRQLKNVAERLVVRWPGVTINARDVAPELTSTHSSGSAASITSVPPDESTRSAALYARMLEGGESFWAVVHGPFMARDLTRQDVKGVIGRGLRETRGNYKSLLRLFNMDARDYRRLLHFLQKNDCHVEFRPFRMP
jgi:DNA-binding NtrC family response regulator